MFGVRARPDYRRWSISAGWIALCLYAPFSWIVLGGSRWSDYDTLWLKLWPILPGLVPGTLVHPDEPLEFHVMGATTALLFVGLSWLGSLGRKCLCLSMALALAISVPSAWLAYSLYLV